MSTTPCDRCEGAGEIQATHGWTTYRVRLQDGSEGFFSRHELVTE